MIHRLFMLAIVPCMLLVAACSEDEKSDAYGNFEAIATTVSAKGTGQLVDFSVQEGSVLEKGQVVGIIDTVQLYLEKALLEAQLSALSEKTREAAPDVAILVERKNNLERELARTQALMENKAATQKQLDDFKGELEVINRQIKSTERQIEISNRGILADRKPLQAQIELLDYRICQQKVMNPVDGTVLTKLAEADEYVSQGTPLYQVASLKELKLRAYTSANLLAKTQLNANVTVLVDDGSGGQKSLPGRVVWIASEAEFTPETIETREDRVDMVYALDVLVANDGSLRIGMPGEVLFSNSGQ